MLWGGGVDSNAIKSIAFVFAYSILFYEAKIFTQIYTSFYSAEFFLFRNKKWLKRDKKLAKGQSSQFPLGQSIISLETGRVALAAVCIFTQRKSDSYLKFCTLLFSLVLPFLLTSAILFGSSIRLGLCYSLWFFHSFCSFLVSSVLPVCFTLNCVKVAKTTAHQRLIHRVHRVATAAFWRTFSDEGKICPGWWGWGGVHAHPLSLHLQSPVKLQCTLQLSGQIHWPCSISRKICTLWAHLPSSNKQCWGSYIEKELSNVLKIFEFYLVSRVLAEDKNA